MGLKPKTFKEWKKTFSFLESKKTFSDKNFQMLTMSDQGVGGHPMGVYMIFKWVFDIFEKKSTPSPGVPYFMKT